jgi:TetR/AcrR family transcriptional regulator, regulator of cefoperazone and chloramphenicol sensitivity
MINTSAYPPPAVPARLLEAASELFAEKGFAGVTTREIAAAAGVTLACINYHFAGKAGLYRTALLEAHTAAAESMRTADGPPEARLRAFIHAMVDRVLDGRQVAVRLLARELAQPTAALDEVVERSIRPTSELLRTIIRNILGTAATDERVRHAAISVIGQCLHWHHGRPMIVRLCPDETFDAARIATHIADLTIAGLQAIAAREHTAETTP